MTLKITIINGAKFGEGTYHSIFDIFNVLNESQTEVEWVQFNDSCEKDHQNFYKYEIKGFCLGRNIFSIGINRVIRRYIKPHKLNTDILLVGDPTLLGNVKGKINSVVLMIHDFRPLTQYRDSFSSKLFLLFSMKKIASVDRIIVSTKYMLDECKKYGLTESKISIVPQTFPFEVSFNRILESNAKVFRILYIAQDRAYKRIDFFINIANQFNNSINNLTYEFTLITKTPRGNKFSQKGLLPDNVILKGSFEDIKIELNKHDLLLFPSEFEGFGRPVLEAMSTGMPVIARDIPPIREITYGSARLLRNDSVEEWKAAILEISTSKEIYEDMSRKVIEAAKNFEYSNFRKSVLNTFHLKTLTP